jgi:MscS family membrane protein
MVWVNEFAASSIDILLYCFLQTPDWPTELRERHRLFLDIIRLAKRLGVEFAFPTQTIHLAKEEGEGAKTPESGSPQGESGGGAEEALALGRREAEKIAKEGLGDSEGRPPPFDFPPVE